MSAGITFGGLASGLDTGAIIDAILSVERRPLNVLQGRKQDEQDKLSLLGTFEGLVNKLRDKAHGLQQAGNFFAHKLSLGTDGIASITLNGSAAAGSHTLKVNTLAAADRYAFDGVSDPDASLGTGTLSFDYGGNTYSVTTVSGSDNLNDIAAAINSAADGVTASVINAGTQGTPSYQLVIAGDSTGADFAITNLNTTVAGLVNPTQVSTATDASVKIDGLDVVRSSNAFTDVLPGISFTVSRTTDTNESLSFTVDVDPEGIRKNIQEFVDAYNAVIDFTNKQNAYSTETGPGGPLFGDNTLGTIRTNLRRALFLPDPTVLANNPDYGSLGTIGINVDNDGRLSIDQSKLDDKLNNDLSAFADFFNRADDESTANVDERGVFVRLEKTLDNVIKSQRAPNGDPIEGLFQARRTAINRLIKGFDDDSQRMQDNLDKLQETLTQKFASLEQLLSGLQSQQAYLNATSGNFTSRR